MYLEFHYANTLDLFAKKSFVPADALGFAERVTQRAVELGLEKMQPGNYRMRPRLRSRFARWTSGAAWEAQRFISRRVR